ncbi:diacylglycerol acyltransferase [Absidia repens]|uniref:Diacylglycerol O-acyltransferase n=1 Tax=Absidia repens TaxID=90262 RepID=A0A1X2IL08_9FUNG|nr:diacylglycerol acyltransferase [Absidia repens]
MLSIVIWLSTALSFTALFLVFWTQPFWFPLALMYMAYIYLDPAPVQGGRRLQSVREWSLWKYVADYFPIQIIKEHDLDPSKNYLFGYHPHGILCFGAVSTFATEGSGFSRLFPGVIPRLATVPFTLFLPFYRDLLLSMGFCSSSRASCEHVLKSGPGESLAIVIGGAVEALSSSPGTNRLVLKNVWASLVPVFAFGEADLYHQFKLADNSIASGIRSFIKKLCGIAVPLFYGRGIFNYDFGLVPYRRPVTVIVGKPISVPKLEKDQVEPSKEQILEVQDRYIKELTGIYDRYKDMYAQDRQQELEIIA